MHPILARRGRLLPYLAASFPLGVVLSVLMSRPGGLSSAEAWALAPPMALLYLFLGLAAWYPCRGLPLGRVRLPVVAATQGAFALATSAVWVFLGAGASRALALVPPFAGLPARYATQVPALFAAGLLLFYLSVALHYVLLSFETARASERRQAELTILAREAELAALKSRVQPHFLFNSLNSISALVGSDPARAREMCIELAEFLRRSLAAGEKERIPISEELALARSYLAVERVRFGGRLGIEERVEESSGRCLVPPLLLQPLVENAVVHGIATLVEGGVVRLEVCRAGGRIRIIVENPLDPEAPARPRTGLGMKIVRERLQALYGADAIFAARRLDGRHLAVLSLPARG